MAYFPSGEWPNFRAARPQTYPYYTSGVQGLVGASQTNYIIVGALTRIYAETSVGITRFDSSTDECRATLSGHLQ
ncbi:MAG TPA: hypothetical protein VFO02_03065, partial [Burkholderiales bacterium]|nr:hypothetical protein [Burkholderiales bacterium]